jgi:predicted O-linked N-acetylglucosamine transferase (SPINDLY family)
VSAHFCGATQTSSADFIDYPIGDDQHHPPHLAAQCSEALVSLPGAFMPYSGVSAAGPRANRRESGLPEDAVVFCCFNGSRCFEPALFSLWMRVLQRPPDSVLRLGLEEASAIANLKKKAVARGARPKRLIIGDFLEHRRHLARIGLADLAFDSLHATAGTTTAAALWAGLPVLTHAGNTPSGRGGVSIVTAAGVPELVVHSLQEYEHRAGELASQPEVLADLDRTLAASRDENPLFGDSTQVCHLEQAYQRMAENWRHDLPPRAFSVTA